MKKMNLSFDTAALTNAGRLRRNNEDRLFNLDKSNSPIPGVGSYGIYLIADGMGGHQAGEVASTLAVDIIYSTIQSNLKYISLSRFPSRFIKQSINEANRAIYSLASKKPELYSMGTTITLGFRLDNELYLGQVGDSRAYLIRTGEIKQLTEDHSLVAHLVKQGTITSEEARFHPDRGKIMRCVGIAGDVDVDTFSLALTKGDVLVFCSDGLTGSVADEDILRCVLEADNAIYACENLINMANSNGGEDNISVIVVKVKSKSYLQK
jgi:PPM family protein phosphatase